MALGIVMENQATTGSDTPTCPYNPPGNDDVPGYHIGVFDNTNVGIWDINVFQNQGGWVDPQMTVQLCMWGCYYASPSAQFAAVYNGDTCNCASTFSPAIQSALNVNLVNGAQNCAGNGGQFCGDAAHADVYFINNPERTDYENLFAPSYMGCYNSYIQADNVALAMPQPSSATIGLCGFECMQVQNGPKPYVYLTDGGTCYCAVGYEPAYFQPPDSCYNPCTGNPGETCGGGNNMYSVYDANLAYNIETNNPNFVKRSLRGDNNVRSGGCGPQQGGAHPVIH
eukprot:TRINITY_DN4735_c1_g1_i1.p1 TRINITY_DN4735_c1_g1~~TRINITY_DN4735_c1_g1_i1.p1  ORF type:complete len:283 (+),score=39.41 TRINITY_DN4735_c1_g1_i1:327-1175(+)